MNHALLSAIFLQKALTYSPRERIFKPEIGIEKSLGAMIRWKNTPSFKTKTAKERNRDFFKQLAHSKRKPAKVINSNYASSNKNRSSSAIPRILSNSRNFPYDKRKTTLIIAPHPDDAVLGTGKLIQEKLKSREKIKIIYLTNGDAMGDETPAAAQNYGRRRVRESQQVARKLGLKKSDLFFLGFPDAYSDKLPQNKAIQSKFTGREKSYRDSYFPNIKYSQNSLINALDKIFTKTNPDEVYFTGIDDNNVDHSAIGKIMMENFAEIPAKKFTYIIHRPQCENEICPCNQEVDKHKLDLINIYQSQRFTPHHEEFLDQFACQKEVFTEVK